MAFVRLQLRNDTAAAWTAANPVLAMGEMAVENNTGKFKIGDGITAWNLLVYGGLIGATGVAGPAGPAGTQGIQGVAGPAGTTGPAGPTGNTGIQGLTGATGLAGAQGTQGLTGATGATGAPGVGFLPRGAWAGTTVYAVNDIVTYAGNVYRVSGAHTSPASFTTVNLELWASKGDVGAAGATGAQGIQGIQGTQGTQGIQGVAGPTGPTGPGFIPRGAYAVTTTYAINDVVTYLGATYRVTTAHTTTGTLGTTNLELWAAKGDTGATGPSGAGTGDVLGPASAVVGNVVLFNAISGKAISDGGTLGTAAFLAATALRDRSTHTGTESLDVTVDSATRLALTPAERTKLTNTTGTNSGDQTSVTGNAGTATALQAAGVDRIKLDGIAAGATANSTDAVLLARGNHTGTQASSTVTVLTTDKLLGRATAGAGPVEEIALTAAGRALIDDTDAAAQRATLGLGTAATTAATAYATAAQGATADSALQPIIVASPASAAGALTLNFALKPRAVFSVTLTENVTGITLSNLPAGGQYLEYEIHYKQNITGGYTVAQPASHKATGGSDTTVATAANAVTVLSASSVDGGVTWRYAMQESA